MTYEPENIEIESEAQMLLHCVIKKASNLLFTDQLYTKIRGKPAGLFFKLMLTKITTSTMFRALFKTNNPTI